MKKIFVVDDFNKVNIKNKNYGNGTWTIQLKSWQEFVDLSTIMKGNTKYIWRGQRKDWQLKSSFDRDPYMQKISRFFGRQEILDVLLKKFKKRLNDLPNKPNIIKDDNIWAIGQHHGLPTPLLDWTVDSFKAAYFAFYEADVSQRERYVYAVNDTVHRFKQIKKNPITKQKLDSRSFIEFLDWKPEDKRLDDLDKRIKAQKAKFTKALNGIDIESNVLHFARKQPGINQKKEILFMKVIIPGILKDDCLANLESKGITHGVLFPDFEGAVDITKIDLGLKK